jgi:hypothetical protein
VARRLVSGAPPTFRAFLDTPDTQLNDWDASGQNGAHYNASELFLAYLFEQTDGTPRDLATEPANGIEGVRTYLRNAGEPRSFEDLAADWAVANLLDQADGPHGYRALDVSAPAMEAVDARGQVEGAVHQFGVDYLELTAASFPSGVSISFQGEAVVPVFAGQNDARGAVWWSGRGDSIDSMLTRELDLTGVATASLTYRTWFDIEEDFDYGYVEASSDAGATWQLLAGRHTTDEDPLERAYGPGYTGRSGGGETASWVDERIDLSAFAGSKILLRFEMVNDDAANRPGWAIDDVTVAEISFFDGAESDPGGWHREGFRRLSEPLAQDFELRAVIMSDTPDATPVELDGSNRATVDLAGLGSEYSRAILVIMGATDGTTEPARYTYDVTAPIR